MAYRLYSKKEWGGRAGHAGGYHRHFGEAVIHYTASEMVDFDIASGKPRKPGPKWYKIWRTPHKTAAEKARRVRIARMIRKYNKSMRKWNLDNAADLQRAIAHEKKMMRAWQGYHMNVLGWSDIGYHYVIFPSGHVYAGRSCDPSGCVYGAHTKGANERIGISHEMTIGDYPTPEMVASYHTLRRKLGIKHAVGHNQVPGNSTSCPGRLIQAYSLPTRY